MTIREDTIFFNVVEGCDNNVCSKKIKPVHSDETAPYGIHINRDRFEDGAIHRGVATLVNQSPRANMTYARFGVSRNRIVLFTNKNIRNDAEILVRYGNEYRFDENTQYATK